MFLGADGMAAVLAWNRMHGVMYWEAIPVVMEMVGIDDAELLLALLEVVALETRGKRDGESGH